jgi:hypothetical protein
MSVGEPVVIDDPVTIPPANEGKIPAAEYFFRAGKLTALDGGLKTANQAFYLQRF